MAAIIFCCLITPDAAAMLLSITLMISLFAAC